VNKARRETSRHCRNQIGNISKVRINESKTNNNKKNCRDLYGGINDFNKDYELITTFIKDEK